MSARIAGTLMLLLLTVSQAIARTTPETILRLGDTSSGDRTLAAELARGYLQSRGGENLKVFSRSGELWISAQLEGAPVQIGVGSSQLDRAWRSLASGDLDLILSAERMAQARRSQLTSADAAAAAAAPIENVIGLHALALAVHPDNPATSVSEAQLRALLRAGGGNWRQFGGADAPIALMVSDQLSTGLQVALLGSKVAGEPVDESALVRKLKHNPATLALVPAVEAERYRTLAVVAAGVPLAPQPALIASEDYPLAQRLYLYSRGDAQNPHRRAFVEFALSSEGQTLIAQNGLISLTPRAVDAQPRRNLPAPYRDLIAQGERLSISFRFEGGGTELDARAQRDIERLLHYLQQPEHREKKIALVGFSDNQRRESMARTISRFRAVKVKQALRQVDIAADRLLSLGSIAPLTLDENTAEQRNSRVEVWLF